MDLNSVWFILTLVLVIGFFLLEGFDYGVGILLPFLGKDDVDRRVIINTIGPFWDGNEVWMVTAGGAMFAAFPEWYATLFSGFYLALVLILLALIVRGVAFEFRSKDRQPAWRNLCVPINADMQYVGGFWDLLSPYALAGGLASLTAFTLHGAIFLSLKTKGELVQRAQKAAARLWLPAVVAGTLFVIAGFIATDIYSRVGFVLALLPLGAAAALLASGWLVRQGRHGWAFAMTSLTIALSVATVAIGLYPRLMVSSLNPDWSLTIYNASSSPYTLTVMTIVALIFVPIVLLYQGWSYWIFRKRIGREDSLEY
jgi:cytochrome d ubiquinol oxidase subunit II